MFSQYCMIKDLVRQWKNVQKRKQTKQIRKIIQKYISFFGKIQSGGMGSSALWASTHPSLIITTNMQMEHVDNICLKKRIKKQETLIKGKEAIFLYSYHHNKHADGTCGWDVLIEEEETLIKMLNWKCHSILFTQTCRWYK